MPEPLLGSLPEGQQALQNKYQTYGAVLSQLPAPIVNSLARFDLERVNRGQRPLSERETTLVIQSAMQGDAVITPPEKGPGESLLDSLNPFGGRDNPILRDLQTIGQAIPRLPLAIAHEFAGLKDVPDAIANADSLGDIAMAPGIRLIPGSYVAGNLLGGTSPEGQQGSPGELAKHPLFTALDVLPFASGAAARTATVRAARLGAVAEGEARAAMSGGVLGGGPIPRPLPTLLTRRLDPTTGAVVPNRVGQLTAGTREMIERTRPGQVMAEAFGAQARDLSRVRAHRDRVLQEQMDPEGQSARVADDAPDTELVALTRQARSLETRFPEITPERRVELTQAFQTDPGTIHTLLGKEAEFTQEVRAITQGFEDVGLAEGLLDRVAVGGQAEVYPVAVAGKIKGRQHEVAHITEIGSLRTVAATGTGVDPAVIADDLLGPLSRTDLGPNETLRAVEARARALHAMGYATDDIITAIGKQRAGVGWDDIEATVRRFNDAGRPTVNLVDVDKVAADLSTLARRDPGISRLTDALKARRWTDATRTLRTLRKRAVYNVIDDIVDPDALKLTLERGRRTDNWLAKTEARYGEKAVTRAHKSVRDLEQRNIPARFVPAVEGQVRDTVKTRLEQFANDNRGTDYAVSPTDLDEWFRLADEGNFSMIEGLGEAEYRAIQRDVARTWQQMRAEGFDPMFVHRVNPRRAGQLAFPHVLERVTTPTQVRERTLDATPYVQDVTVALSHQGLEWLSRKGSEQLIDDVINVWGRSEDTVRKEYLEPARAVHALDPKVSVQEAMVELMEREWTRFDPEQFITWPSKFKAFADDVVMVPRGVANNIQRIHTPPAGKLTAVMDPVMGAFRTSILPLSPRWHVYNILGGGIMLLGQTDPRVFMYAARAWNATKKGADDVLPESVGHGMGSTPAYTREWDQAAKVTATSALDKRLAAMHGVFGGRTLRRVWDSTQLVRDKFGNVVQKSYDLNARFDDMYRAMGYLYDYDRAVKRGMSVEQAQQAGIRTVRKVMQDWDAITPIERSILRYVFPFYGWMQHIMRYVLTYPMDHPVRASIMASFARNELEDMGDGLPERFLNMFFVGPTDLNGDTKAIQLQGANPFADVANYFTLEGFLGQVNPIVGGIAQSLGIDVRSGTAELYPDLEYDPETGRLRATSRNPLTTITQATIPQSRVLFNLAGQNAEWKEVLRRNPEAAQRMFLSQIGVPVVLRDVRVNEERFKAELARDEGLRDAFNEALATGDDTVARRYEVLGPLLDQIRQLQGQGQLEGYTPESAPTSWQTIMGSVGQFKP